MSCGRRVISKWRRFSNSNSSHKHRAPIQPHSLPLPTVRSLSHASRRAKRASGWPPATPGCSPISPFSSTAPTYFVVYIISRSSPLPSFHQRRCSARILRCASTSHHHGARPCVSLPPIPIHDSAHPCRLHCRDADAVCQHVSVLSTTQAHLVANPLAVVQHLLQSTSVAG
jgi:hypothetical protein